MACKECKKKNRKLPDGLEYNLSTGAKILLYIMGILIITSIYGIYSLITKLL